jgi:hypothetical protein
MKTHIFIRSHAKDFPWLAYALRSIKKYCTGFTGVTVVIPNEDYPQAMLQFQGHGMAFFSVYLPGPKRMLEAEVQLCNCETIVPPDTTHVLLTDSDCIFTRPTCPEDYTVGGKPVMIGHPFKDFHPDAGQWNWFKAVKAELGFEPEYEFMTRHPALYPVWLFPLFRNAVEHHTGQKFAEYVLSCRNEYPQTFAELTGLGAFAHKYFADRFYTMYTTDPETMLVNADSGRPAREDHLQQFWSWNKVTDYTGVLEKILA